MSLYTVENIVGALEFRGCSANIKETVKSVLEDAKKINCKTVFDAVMFASPGNIGLSMVSNEAYLQKLKNKGKI